MTRSVLLLNGPNLNLLGHREPDIYGSMTLNDIVEDLRSIALRLDVIVRDVQSNHEGVLIDSLHDARSWADGAICNPGAFTHSSYALREAIVASGLPVVEAHLSNVQAREEFRHHSITAPACIGVVSGFGFSSYRLALDGLLSHLNT